jgi:carbamoyltransferase
MNILGINAWHGDAAACLLQDGEIVAAAAEERFVRLRHCAGFPGHAVRFCLREGGITARDLDHVAVSRDPSARMHQSLMNALARLPAAFSLKERLQNVGKPRDLRAALAGALGVSPEELTADFRNVEHHQAHMASAFFVSPFQRAALLSVDGFGDFVSTMIGQGQGNRLEVLDWVEYPHSLGILYTATSQYLGFRKYGDEGKVMGLAPYGQPRYLDRFQEILRLKPQGKFELDLDYFTHHRHGVEMVWEAGTPAVSAVFSARYVDALGPARFPDAEITRHHQDVAASLQECLEGALSHILADLHRRLDDGLGSEGSLPLCLAGGVALNCTANGKIRDRTPFQEIYIQPAAGDDGTAIGAAYYVHHQLLAGGDDRPVDDGPRAPSDSMPGAGRGAPRFVMRHAYTGPAFSDDRLRSALELRGLRYTSCAGVEEAAGKAAAIIAQGGIVGWFQGPMEYGPRALGNRSIVADPRRAEMKEILNARIKHREGFRPFAPSALAERAGEWFEHQHPSPFMQMAVRVRPEKRDLIPAVVHIDGTARLQTVERETNPDYWRLIHEFDALTGVPLLLNTSFNENEPIVCTPDDAIDCYRKTAMDALVMGSFLVRRE